MKDNKILFSIITPIYNGEKYLEHAIESVVKQKCKEWELILVDDGSMDSSSAICRKYSQKDSRILFFDKINSGVSDTRNLGLEKATGEWIVFLDADDWLEEDYLYEMKKKLLETETDLIICNYYDAIEEKKRCERDITVDLVCDAQINEVVNASLRQSQWHGKEWYGNLRTVWAKCFKHQFIYDNNLQFDSRLKIGEDMVFVLGYLQYTKRIDFLNCALYNYRYNLESVMHTKQWHGNEQGKLYFQLVDSIVGDNIQEGAKADLWLETAETDWQTLHCASINWYKKYYIFKELFNDGLYKRFSIEKAYEYSSLKQKIYAFLIRNRMVLLLMMLSYYRVLKHKNDLERELKNDTSKY